MDNQTQTRVLIIEDEQDVADMIKWQLEREGYQARTADRAIAGLDQAREWLPDVVLLDIQMPGMDGWEACNQLRATSSAPVIIFVTALGSEDDKVRGLNMGADDYLVKPFGDRELQARIELALRRRQPVEANKPRVYTSGDFSIQWDAGQAFVRGRPVHLTRTQFKLLAILVEHEGQTLTYDYLNEAMWGIGKRQNNDQLKYLILRIRRGIEDDPSHPKRVVLHHRIGYRFASADQLAASETKRKERRKSCLKDSGIGLCR